MGDKILFRPHHGGFGDSLIYSTLPERWVREQGSEFWVVNPNWRNPGVYPLIWECNPFVSGQVEDTGHTHMATDDKRRIALTMEYENNIKGVESYFGFSPLGKHPKIYYQYKFKREFADKVLIDCRAYSVPFTKESFEPFVYKLIERGLFTKDQLIMLDSDYPLFYNDRLGLGRGDLIFPELPIYKPRDVFDWADSIFSCKRLLCVTSGTAGLASAIRGDSKFPKVNVLAPIGLFNQKYWVYNNLDYSITGQLSPGEDWKEY